MLKIVKKIKNPPYKVSKFEGGFIITNGKKGVFVVVEINMLIFIKIQVFDKIFLINTDNCSFGSSNGKFFSEK